MESEKAPQPLDIMSLVVRFIKAFRQLWALVLILVFGFSAAKWFMAWRSYTPYYQTTAIFSVSSRNTLFSILTVNSVFTILSNCPI